MIFYRLKTILVLQILFLGINLTASSNNRAENNASNVMPRVIILAGDKKTLEVPGVYIAFFADKAGRDYKKFSVESFKGLSIQEVFQKQSIQEQYRAVLNHGLRATGQAEVSKEDFDKIQ